MSRYLSDAATAIFTPSNDSTDAPPWGRASTPFSGSIIHHEELGKLRELRDAVRAARLHLEGCTDPAAANFNPSATHDDGSCTYTVAADGDGRQASTGSYITTTIQRLFGPTHTTGDASEPESFYSTGYSSPARTQRELQREVDRLTRFERLVQRTIEEGEKQQQ